MLADGGFGLESFKNQDSVDGIPLNHLCWSIKKQTDLQIECLRKNSSKPRKAPSLCTSNT